MTRPAPMTAPITTGTDRHVPKTPIHVGAGTSRCVGQELSDNTRSFQNVASHSVLYRCRHVRERGKQHASSLVPPSAREPLPWLTALSGRSPRDGRSFHPSRPDRLSLSAYGATCTARYD